MPFFFQTKVYRRTSSLKSPGFIPFNKESLLSQVVEVATEFADGPVPKALTTAPKPDFLYRMPNADAFVLLNSPDAGGLSIRSVEVE